MRVAITAFIFNWLALKLAGMSMMPTATIKAEKYTHL
jgi:hypothetical protein